MSNEPRRRALIARTAAGIALLISAAAYGSAVTGTVTDASTGVRLPSMIVHAYAANGTDPGLLSTTDSNGKYILSLPPGDYRILAYDQTGVYATSFAADAESFETSPVLKANGDVSNYNFALRTGGSVSGRVIAASAPVSQAVVAVYNLSGTRRGFTVSDAFGDYSIVVPPGSYKLVAYDENKVYAPTFYSFASSFNAAAEVNVAAGKTTQAVDFVLPRAGRITGFVVAVNTGGAVKGMLVEAYNQSGERIASQQMAADQFDLALPAGTYRLVIADLTHLYAPALYGGAASFDDSTAITVGAGELRAGLRFEVLPAGHISGRASSETGEPLAITVAAYNID
ncbi:MAG: MSCRAMM family protein, partial [Thermoanaerobaculia bacterium]